MSNLLEKNYTTWLGISISIVCYWKKELRWLIDVTDCIPTDDSKLAHWKVKDARLMSWIIVSCDPEIVLSYVYVFIRLLSQWGIIWKWLIVGQTLLEDFNWNVKLLIKLNEVYLFKSTFLVFKVWVKFSDTICANVYKDSLSDILVIHEVCKCDKFLIKLCLDFENTCFSLMSRKLLREEHQLLTQGHPATKKFNYNHYTKTLI